MYDMSSPEGNKNPEQKAEAEHLLSVFEITRNLKKALFDDTVESNRVAVVEEAICRIYGPLFAGREDALITLFMELKAKSFRDDMELIEMTARRLYEFAFQNFTLHELEARAGTADYRGENKIRLSAILDCNISYVHPDIIKLHIKPGASLPQMELIREVRQGLAELADKLRHDLRFAPITLITGKSWLVLKYSRIFQRMGFEIKEPTERELAAGERYVTMSREDFLSRYEMGNE